MKDVQEEEKDFIIVNLTFGYILAIEAKSTLNSKSTFIYLQFWQTCLFTNIIY